MVSYVNGGAQVKGIWKQDPEVNVWTQEGCGRLHNEEHHSLYRFPNIVRVKFRRLRWAGHVARMEDSISAFKILTSTPTGKGPLGRPRRSWEVSIRIDLKKHVSVQEVGLIRLRIGIIEEPLQH
jgi:hypothetical protein